MAVGCLKYQNAAGHPSLAIQSDFLDILGTY